MGAKGASMTASTPTPIRTDWVNLSNGIEALTIKDIPDPRFLYLRSSHCEAGKWDRVMASVPDEMLLRLALGETCVVHDYGARKGVPRSIWQGLEFVKYVLYRRWLGLIYQPAGRAAPSAGYFSWNYHQIIDNDPKKQLKRRLDYFVDYLATEVINLASECGSTHHDGNKEFYRWVLLRRSNRV